MGHENGIDRFAGIELTEIASGLQFPEGPVALSDGSVLVVEIQGRCLTRIGPDGARETVAEFAGAPNGAAIGPDGAVYLCDNGGYFDYDDTSGVNVPSSGASGWRKGSIQRVDLATGETEELYTEADGHRLLAPNDLVFDAHGGFWFSDHGVHAHDTDVGAAVLYARADGSTIRGVISGLDATNGVGLSPDGTRLYVVETYRGRVLAWDVTGPGEVADPGDPQVMHDAGGTAMFDSLAVDADGSVCVATLLTGGVSVVSPEGSVEFLATGDPLTTNICFGGDDLRTAWITSSGTGRLLRCRWPVPGLRLAHAG